MAGTVALIPMGLERDLYLKKLAELSGVSLNRLLKTILRERVPEREQDRQAEPEKISFN
jgi:hypothetical protein